VLSQRTPEADSPIANGEGHGVPNKDDGRHGIPTNFRVTVDQIIHAERDAKGVRASQNSHGEYQAKPVDVVGRPDAPEDERCRHDDEADGKWPQSMFRLHDAVVAPRQFDGQPVAESTGDERAERCMVSQGLGGTTSTRQSYPTMTPTRVAT